MSATTQTNNQTPAFLDDFKEDMGFEPHQQELKKNVMKDLVELSEEQGLIRQKSFPGSRQSSVIRIGDSKIAQKTPFKGFSFGKSPATQQHPPKEQPVQKKMSGQRPQQLQKQGQQQQPPPPQPVLDKSSSRSIPPPLHGIRKAIHFRSSLPQSLQKLFLSNNDTSVPSSDLLRVISGPPHLTRDPSSKRFLMKQPSCLYPNSQYYSKKIIDQSAAKNQINLPDYPSNESRSHFEDYVCPQIIDFNPRSLHKFIPSKCESNFNNYKCQFFKLVQIVGDSYQQFFEDCPKSTSMYDLSAIQRLATVRSPTLSSFLSCRDYRCPITSKISVGEIFNSPLTTLQQQLTKVKLHSSPYSHRLCGIAFNGLKLNDVFPQFDSMKLNNQSDGASTLFSEDTIDWDKSKSFIQKVFNDNQSILGAISKFFGRQNTNNALSSLSPIALWSLQTLMAQASALKLAPVEHLDARNTDFKKSDSQLNLIDIRRAPNNKFAHDIASAAFTSPGLLTAAKRYESARQHHRDVVAAKNKQSLLSCHSSTTNPQFSSFITSPMFKKWLKSPKLNKLPQEWVDFKNFLHTDKLIKLNQFLRLESIHKSHKFKMQSQDVGYKLDSKGRKISLWIKPSVLQQAKKELSPVQPTGGNWFNTIASIAHKYDSLFPYLTNNVNLGRVVENDIPKGISHFFGFLFGK
jgi:hypothetical protein